MLLIPSKDATLDTVVTQRQQFHSSQISVKGFLQVARSIASQLGVFSTSEGTTVSGIPMRAGHRIAKHPCKDFSSNGDRSIAEFLSQDGRNVLLGVL